MRKADPGSPIDVIYVSGDDDDSDPALELTIFKRKRSAMRHASLLEETTGFDKEVVRVNNAILVLSRSIPDSREDRLVTALKSIS